MANADKPSVTVAPDGPLIVQGLDEIATPDGPLPIEKRVAICRCGASEKLPLCDGTHARIDFSGSKGEGGPKDRRRDYVGASITVHDNRSICAHAATCVEKLPQVFRMKERPWIAPDEASTDEVIEAVLACPSGALSYTVDGVEHREKEAVASAMTVKGGPLVLMGGVQVQGAPLAEGAAEGHSTLCRCGASLNKPFCDGAHWKVEFDGPAGERSE